MTAVAPLGLVREAFGAVGEKRFLLARPLSPAVIHSISRRAG